MIIYRPVKRVLVVFGTRPEAIKLAPLINQLRTYEGMEVVVCSTAQHRQMLDQVLQFFRLEVEIDLDLMTEAQTLADLTSSALKELARLLDRNRPDVLIVQGDTSTAMAAALAAFYARVPVAHLEAGLRTRDMTQPFPEEFNRRTIASICDIHFAPTPGNRENLIAEGVAPERIHVVGNTVIDALKIVSRRYSLDGPIGGKTLKKPFILVTAHRRENFGPGMETLFRSIHSIVELVPGIEVYFPVHLNPRVREPVESALRDTPGVYLLPPVDYLEFLSMLHQCHLVISDSGGVQEEAAYMGKPVLILREKTERYEFVEVGGGSLMGSDRDRIVRETLHLFEDEGYYRSRSCPSFVFGDGSSSSSIAAILSQYLDIEGEGSQD